MENKNNKLNDFVKPILVLAIICFVVTFALAYAYGVTNPIIEARAKADADATRMELLSDADAFTPIDEGQLYQLDGKVFAKEAYTADNGSGMVVTVSSNSYGGAMVVMVGIDKEGAVTGVKVTSHADTAGVGTKAIDSEDHRGQYKGLTELDNIEVKKCTQVNAVSGASVSSGAIHKAVYCALEQFKAVK